ncbi:hypothetical protein GPECTOR_12g570 [Gonium pectorale]|uniref:m7GpppX diphosphatase n=1 Tax=Gonium pectorale TaxID=33097 RepID=A0A150GP19_GONPE|nr:hypothetical protein GPECTOR_12g570 [Gonium pectorale]|eukprot:KXZ51606.1 hypothetical protein GPECTOR_12g570 [Gonium pectorale]
MASSGELLEELATFGASAAERGRLSSFKDFSVVEVLNEDPLTKSIALLGRFAGRNALAVLLLNRKPFDKSSLDDLVGERLKLTHDFANDIYSKYVGVPPPEQAALTVDLIYPATNKHIAKHRQQRKAMVRMTGREAEAQVTETPELYERVVLPYIRSFPPARLQWVYNILEKKEEVERLIYEDPDPVNGFMLHPDLKWDQRCGEQLYCLALVHRRDLPCVRELRVEHLPLLENVRDRGCQAIQDRYGVPRSSLRLFVHYLPSYWHLHVHIVHADLLTHGSVAGKAILLDDVIDNIKTFGSDYWRRRSLTYQLGEADDLWRLLGPVGESAGGRG